MDLHLHLSVAFRALDRKWGNPVDLDTSGESLPCEPAVIEDTQTTFFSEDYLKSRRPRPTPYSRYEERRVRRENIKKNDSFGNISSYKAPSLCDLEVITSSILINEDKMVNFSLKIDCCDYSEMDSISSSTMSLTSTTERSRSDKNAFKQLKQTAVKYKRRFLKNK